MLNTYTSFKLLYYALDSIFDETKEEGLGEFCSNMNPFIFADEGSADPAIYSNYKKQFEERFNIECSISEAYEFAKEYSQWHCTKVAGRCIFFRTFRKH